MQRTENAIEYRIYYTCIAGYVFLTERCDRREINIAVPFFI